MASKRKRALSDTQLSHALIRAMVAVRAGKVMRWYSPMGNNFQAPRGIAPQTLRRLEALCFIEDAPGGPEHVRRVQKQLSPKGREALARLSEGD